MFLDVILQAHRKLAFEASILRRNPAIDGKRTFDFNNF